MLASLDGLISYAAKVHFKEKVSAMKDIPGYEGKYSITRDGRVWSHPRVDAKGATRKGKWLKSASGGHGYPHVSLYRNGIESKKTVHRLVAEAFIPKMDGKPDINHINGIKTDSRVENLEWVTRAENMQHAYDTGLNVLPSGELNHFAKLTKEEVISIRNVHGLSMRELEEVYGVSRSHIWRIRNGKLWNHI
ncbi:NUMOD4 motif [Yersinia enterocolitica]|uniref:HNH endonuclease n=1 Tax=Yersinia enterocolitica TaxID=630 RepID=UPI0005E773FC|nr:HNH endonuclease [Yersinia enterocolitica]CNL29804.1 NUMOD4 motif [Yersinia enterocolitica]